MESWKQPQQRHQESEPMRELRNLAYMYYAMGNYAKAEEILGLIQGIEAREAKRAAEQRKAA